MVKIKKFNKLFIFVLLLGLFLVPFIHVKADEYVERSGWYTFTADELQFAISDDIYSFDTSDIYIYLPCSGTLRSPIYYNNTYISHFNRLAIHFKQGYGFSVGFNFELINGNYELVEIYNNMVGGIYWIAPEAKFILFDSIYFNLDNVYVYVVEDEDSPTLTYWERFTLNESIQDLFELNGLFAYVDDTYSEAQIFDVFQTFADIPVNTIYNLTNFSVFGTTLFAILCVFFTVALCVWIFRRLL